MERIKCYIEKYRLIVFLAILIVLIVFTIVFMLNRKNSEEVEVKLLDEILVDSEEQKEEVVKYKVDIKGYVQNQGVYELDSNSRIIDVINAAGGLIEGANTEYINLSKKIKDEMIIIIYSNSDVEKFKETEKQIIYIEYECVCPDNKNDACINEDDVVNTNGVKEEENIDNKVSINKATIEELMTLSGIGESKAKAIIDYREQFGEFENIEDIKNVSGIGEAAYSKIKDSIKL